ncbi:MAG: hypothetical protein LBD58_06210 [Treponema sp.]|nr:hypothetical protein [Treponema sp.]
MDWSRNFIALVAFNAVAWGIPQAAATFLQSLFADCETKPDNHGKVDVAEKTRRRMWLGSMIMLSEIIDFMICRSPDKRKK